MREHVGWGVVQIFSLLCHQVSENISSTAVVFAKIEKKRLVQIRDVFIIIEFSPS